MELDYAARQLLREAQLDGLARAVEPRRGGDLAAFDPRECQGDPQPPGVQLDPIRGAIEPAFDEHHALERFAPRGGGEVDGVRARADVRWEPETIHASEGTARPRTRHVRNPVPEAAGLRAGV